MLRKALLCCFLLLGLFACSTPAGEMPLPEVSPQVLPPMTPSPTPDCLPAAGVKLDVIRINDSTAVLHATGLQPGEVPSLFYSTVGNAGGSRGEAWNFAQGADQRGEFSTELDNLEPPQGQARATWDIRLVHQRGVACATITLP